MNEYYYLPAIHEAAHAIAATALGWLVEEVTITPRANAGATGIPDIRRIPAADRAVIVLSGMTAEVMSRRDGGPHEALRRCLSDTSNDGEILAGALKELAPDEGERLHTELRLANLTWGLLERYGPQHGRLTARLERQGSMTGAEVANMMGLPIGKMPAGVTTPAGRLATRAATQGRPVTVQELRQLAQAAPAGMGRNILEHAVARAEGKTVAPVREYATFKFRLTTG